MRVIEIVSVNQVPHLRGYHYHLCTLILLKLILNTLNCEFQLKFWNFWKRREFDKMESVNLDFEEVKLNQGGN